MSTSTISTNASAAWSIYQFNPKPPPEPPNFGQYVTSSDTNAASTGVTGSLSSAAGGHPNIGADLKALLLDLQSGGTTRKASTSNSTSVGASADTTGTATTSAPGTGDVVSDLNKFFSDLQSAGGGTGGTQAAERHHHHGGPPPGSSNSSSSTSAVSADPFSTTSSSNSSSTSSSSTSSSNTSTDLLSYIVKSLKNYGSLNSSQGQSSLALSA